MMQSLENFRKQLKNTQDMLSVVKTMKSLSAVKIRQYEQSIDALQVYSQTIVDGLHIVLRQQEPVSLEIDPFTEGNIGAVVFGSDQGLVGQFNEQVTGYALEQLNKYGDDPSKRQILTVGYRIKEYLLEAGQGITNEISFPGSIDGVTSVVQKLLIIIDDWRNEQQIERIMLFYNSPSSGTSYESQLRWLFPLNPRWLRQIQECTWESRSLPVHTMSQERLFSNLIHEYFFITLYQAFVESLVSENASRLASMQAAERNIEDRLSHLQQQYHQQRQTAITEEILDIISGFEALTG